MTIDGDGGKLDGGGLHRGLFVFAGSVMIENLTIADAHAVGGAGGDGEAGGGGCAGLGGGLVVAGTSAGGYGFDGAPYGGGGGGLGGRAALRTARIPSAAAATAGSASARPATMPGRWANPASSLGQPGPISAAPGVASIAVRSSAAPAAAVASTLAWVASAPATAPRGGDSGGGGAQNSAGAGFGYGGGLFLQGNQTQMLAPASGTTLTISDAIADQSGKGGAGSSAGSGGLVIDGAGTVDLGAANSFAGGVTIDSGTLVLGNAAGAGSGTITFGTGDPPDLQFTIANKPTNTIAGFATDDTIDVTDMTGTAATATLGSGATLAIPYNTGTLDLTFAGVSPGQAFDLTTDGNSGTDITIACYCRGTLILTERGGISVEDLRIGDRLVTAAGALRPLRWIGRRSTAAPSSPATAACCRCASPPARWRTACPNATCSSRPSMRCSSTGCWCPPSPW